MAQPLTAIERRIYNYLVDYLKRETHQPSIREIGEQFGIRSTKTVTEHIQALQRKGYIDRVPSRSRALKIHGLNLSAATYTVPLYRSGRDGQTEEVETRFDLDRALACSPDCYLVRADGDGARELGVLCGDLVLVDPSAVPGARDTRVYETGGRLELCAGGDHDTSPSTTSSDGNGSRSVRRLLGVARAVLRVLPRA